MCRTIQETNKKKKKIVNVWQNEELELSSTFCLLLMPGLLGVEVGECLEMGVESWLLDPVPLAERGERWRESDRRTGGEEVAWIRVKPETLYLALEKKSFLNCGLIWLRGGKAPPPPPPPALQVEEADEFCVCWMVLYWVSLRPATLLSSRLCGSLCLCVGAVRGDVFVHVKCLKSFLSTRDEKNWERCGPDGRCVSQPATVERLKASLLQPPTSFTQINTNADLKRTSENLIVSETKHERLSHTSWTEHRSGPGLSFSI